MVRMKSDPILKTKNFLTEESVDLQHLHNDRKRDVGREMVGLDGAERKKSQWQVKEISR